MTKDTSEILKMAFGLSELLYKQFPNLRFKVLPGLMVSVEAEEESTSACVISDRYQITITEDRIVLNVTSTGAIEVNGAIQMNTNLAQSMVMIPDPGDTTIDGEKAFEYSFVLDKPEQQHVFALQDPQAIDRIIEVINEDIGK